VLGAPLGRQLLAEFLGFFFEHTLFERLGLGEAPGTARFTAAFGEAPPRRNKGRVRHRDWTEVESQEAHEVIRDIITEGHWRTLNEIDPLDLLTELAHVSNSFGFGGGDEALWGLTDLASEALRPVAQALVSSPAASRWWHPVQRVEQRLLEWDDIPTPVGAETEDAVSRSMAIEREENEDGRRRKRPRERAGTRIGAHWWSSPNFAPSTWTTGAFEDIPTIALGHFIDTHTPFSDVGATVWTLGISPAARVLEILRPSDWHDLVERYPRDVTGTHDGEWRYWGGVAGPWCLPDWEQVMDSFDGVHVTIGGYVSTCGLALPVGDGFTMLAGWIPDATLWLHDVATNRRRLGRWQGNPQSVSDWDDVRDRWDRVGRT